MIEILFTLVAFLIAGTGAIFAIQKTWKAGEKLLEAIKKEAAKRRRRRQALNPGTGRAPALPKEGIEMTNRELLMWVLDQHRTETELREAATNLGITLSPTATTPGEIAIEISYLTGGSPLDETARWSPPAPPAATAAIVPPGTTVVSPAPAAPAAPAIPVVAQTPTTVGTDWTCPQGHTNPNTSLFCTQCGTAKPMSGGWTCPQGHANAGSAAFCSVCGENRNNRHGTNNPLEFLLPRPDSPLGRIFRRQRH